MKKFTDVDSSTFRSYDETHHVSEHKELFVLEPFKFHCQFSGKRLEVVIPAGFVFSNKRVPIGFQSIVGTNSLYPQGAAVLEALYSTGTVCIGGMEIRSNSAQRKAVIETMLTLILDRKQAFAISYKLIDYNESVKNNNNRSTYAVQSLALIRETLTKEKSCQLA